MQFIFTSELSKFNETAFEVSSQFTERPILFYYGIHLVMTILILF